jgi:hypothetical protein
MLYMVVANHNPESCPVHNQEIKQQGLANYKRMPEVAKKLNVTSQGSWTYMPGHLIYMLVDAPNAHVVSQMVMEIGIMDWNTVVINPVIPMEEGLKKV